MAVIKCSNCENEILDSEVVCPYCDCPLSETVKKMSKDDLADFSVKSIDSLTGKIPSIKNDNEKTVETKKDSEPQIATSSDFEKEKAAILKDLQKFMEENEADKKNTEDTSSQLDKTVKLSKDKVTESKTQKKTSVQNKKPVVKEIKNPVAKTKKKTKSKLETKYVILAVTIIGIIIIASLIVKISGSITDGINRQKKTNKTVAVTSSAEEIAKQQGFTFSSSSLEITDEKVMINYSSPEETPWYQYKDSIKHITINSNITQIGSHAFDGFYNVTDITLSKDVSVIGDYAFYNCISLKKVRLPDNNELLEIGDSAFENCSNLEFISGYTKDAKFDPAIIAIGDRAFASCSSILEFKLPDDVKLGEDVFKAHNEDFVIICSESGNAYDYATEHEIETKRDFDQGIIEEEVQQEIKSDASEQTSTDPQTQPETTPQTHPETTPQTQPQTTPQTQPQTTPQTQPQTTPQTQPETTPQTQPQTTPQTQPETTPQTQPQTTPQTQPETTPQTQPETTPQTQPETTPQTQPQTTPQTQPETTPQTQPETTPQTQPETTPQTQPTNEQMLQDLNTKLTQATTEAEREMILNEMEKYY